MRNLFSSIDNTKRARATRVSFFPQVRKDPEVRRNLLELPQDRARLYVSGDGAPGPAANSEGSSTNSVGRRSRTHDGAPGLEPSSGVFFGPAGYENTRSK